jgi:thymidylate synthase
MTELIDKKSRFLAYSADIADETEVKAFIERLKKEHKRSSHVVYAYVLAGKEKFNDDGEPKGTAGLPVLNAIKRRDLENVIVVVIRYFGGILLGKGGLMRAYGKAAGRELDKKSEKLCYN